MRRILIIALSLLPTLEVAQSAEFDDGPWIAIAAGMTFQAQQSPIDKIKAMADLDGNPDVTTAEEIKMIALLSQILGAAPVGQ